MSARAHTSPDARLRTAEQTIEQLQRALHSRGTIEQAKGVLMAAFRCDPAAAWSLLVRISQHMNLKLRDIAGLIVEMSANASDPLDRELRERFPIGPGEGAEGVRTDLQSEASRRDHPESEWRLFQGLIEAGWTPPAVVMASLLAGTSEATDEDRATVRAHAVRAQAEVRGQRELAVTARETSVRHRTDHSRLKATVDELLRIERGTGITMAVYSCDESQARDKMSLAARTGGVTLSQVAEQLADWVRAGVRNGPAGAPLN